MIKIVRTESNQWGIMAPSVGVIMEPGDFNEMIDQAEALGIKADELDVAFKSLESLKHNCAEFGTGLIQGRGPTFMFTHVVKVVTRQMAMSVEGQKEYLSDDTAPGFMQGLS